MSEPHALPDIARVHLSEDVLTDIVSHLPSSEKQRLARTSRVFFRSALEVRYHTFSTKDQDREMRRALRRFPDVDAGALIVARMRRLRYAEPVCYILHREPHSCSLEIHTLLRSFAKSCSSHPPPASIPIRREPPGRLMAHQEMPASSSRR
jgi:hypothetical protein